MKTTYTLDAIEYQNAQIAFQEVRKILDAHNPYPNLDAENIPDLNENVSITAGALHEMESQLIILAAQLGIYQ
ncbi:MAG: hypothetical protein K2X66_10430 [Cyanobacteria bacterium]|nr:hypothetical protein [Cyanobacteriota bacterium]